jgi:hypothetical protein
MNANELLGGFEWWIEDVQGVTLDQATPEQKADALDELSCRARDLLRHQGIAAPYESASMTQYREAAYELRWPTE